MFPVNPPGNRNYALSYRRLSSDSSGSSTRAGQSNHTAAVADHISFSTATIGSMMLYVGKIITALSEYEKLLLSTVLAPDTEKKPCSELPDENGIYSWVVDLSQYKASHLLHDAPEQVMVTSALDSSLSCIYRIIISDLSLQHGQLHCDASFDWTENCHPEISFNFVLPHPAQVSFQQLVVILEHTAMRSEELKYSDKMFQHQQSKLANYQHLIADDQQTNESIKERVETPSSRNVSPDINNHHITPVASHNLKFMLGHSATDKDIDEHIALMFSKGKTLYSQIRESLNSVRLGASTQRIKERRDKFYQDHNIPDKLPKASDAKITEHINKVSGKSLTTVINSLRKEKLRVNQEDAARLLYQWREENIIEAMLYPKKRKSARLEDIKQHIKKTDAAGKLSIINVIRSLNEESLGARNRRIAPLLTEYLQQKEGESNRAK